MKLLISNTFYIKTLAFFAHLISKMTIEFVMKDNKFSV